MRGGCEVDVRTIERLSTCSGIVLDDSVISGNRVRCRVERRGLRIES